MTPLVDVIFLLLLFFMLSSTFNRYGQVDIDGGAAGAGSANRPDILVMIGRDQVRVNGETPPTDNALIARLAELEAAGAETAMIRVDPATTSEALVTFLEMARRNTQLEFSLVR